MQKIHLISSVKFKGLSHGDFDNLSLETEAVVNEAIARREIPHVPIHSALHVAHPCERAVQDYLTQTGIPTFPISRFYFGSQATGQWGRQTVTFDGSWADLFLPETSAFTQNKTTLTRSISNLQPHAKGTYAFAIDQEKHFSGTLAWENGRSAPSFAYLNKVTVGVQVVY